MAALNDEGLIRPTQAEIAEQMLEDQRGSISAALDGSESTFIGNFNAIGADALAQAWEALEEAVVGMDPQNATGARMVALALLTGTIREPAQKGTVTATINVDAGVAFDAGELVAHVQDQPENRWLLRDDFPATTAGAHSAVFESEDTGPDFTAVAGTLTVIATPVTGWNSVTNAADATPGREEETIEELRERREQELANGGAGTLDAIRANVLQVDEVIDCQVEENVLDVTVGDLTPHSIRVIVWDGDPAAAEDDEIAQAIHDGGRSAGIALIGTDTGEAENSQGFPVSVAFERVTVLDIYVSANVTSAVGVSEDDVKAAILAEMPTGVGDDVVIRKLQGGPFEVDGVDDLASFTIGTSASPVGTSNITVSSTQIARLQLANIVLTGDVS
jgi:uncharacterized phage protein gp47/JayE